MTFSSVSNPTAQISIVKSKIPMAYEGCTITIEVEDVDIMYERAASFGYKVTYAIRDEPWGVRRFFVLDPNGVTINVMSHI